MQELNVLFTELHCLHCKTIHLLKGGQQQTDKGLCISDLPQTYLALTTDLSRTYHALFFALVLYT